MVSALARGRLVRAVGAFAVTVAVVAVPALAYADVTSKPARSWGTNGRVSVILPAGDRIYIGGSFTSVVDPSGVSHPAKNLAVVSASTGAADLDFDAGTDTGPGTVVTALATDGTRLFVGGLFKSIDGVSRSNLAAVDPVTGALVSDWTASASGSVDALSFTGGALYAAGLFSAVRSGGGSGVLSQPYLAKVDPVTGLVDTGWTPTADDRVRALAPAADGTGRLFLAGDFNTVSGAATHKLAAVSLADPGTVDPGFIPGPNNGSSYATVFDVTADAGRVYAAVGGSGGACTALAATTGARLWSDHSNGNMQSVRLIGDVLYCGGHYGGTGSFTTAAGTVSRQKLASVSAATGAVTSFAPKINSPLGVWSLGTDPTQLYVGGDFTDITGVAQPYFAQFPLTKRPPTAPTLYAQPGEAVVHLSWTAPSTDGGSPVTKYRVYRSTTAGSYGTKPYAILLSGTRIHDDTGVANGTTYFYKVTAVNAVGESPASAERPATPDANIVPTAPSSPVGLTATNPPGNVHLTWNPPTDNGGAPVTSYNIYRSTLTGAEELYATADTASYDDMAIVADTTYYYQVTAVNSVNLEGARSDEDFTTAQPGLPGPPALSGTAGAGVIHLSWTIPSDGGLPITKYIVLRNDIRIKVTKDATFRTYDDTAVTPGTTYVYQVAALNSLGRGQLSNKVTIAPS